MIREEILISNFTPSAAAAVKTAEISTNTDSGMLKWFFIISAIILVMYLVYKWLNPTPPAPQNP